MFLAIGFFKNKFSLIAFALGFILLNAVLLCPPLYNMFGITKLETANFIQTLCVIINTNSINTNI